MHLNVSADAEWVSLHPGLRFPTLQGLRVEIAGQVLSQGGNVGADQVADTTAVTTVRWVWSGSSLAPHKALCKQVMQALLRALKADEDVSKSRFSHAYSAWSSLEYEYEGKHICALSLPSFGRSMYASQLPSYVLLGFLLTTCGLSHQLVLRFASRCLARLQALPTQEQHRLPANRLRRRPPAWRPRRSPDRRCC